MNANADILEKVEYLREKSDIGYEEALVLLERFDGDMTRILIELERSNRLRREPETVYAQARPDRPDEGSFTAESGDPCKHRHHIKRDKIVNVLFHNRLQITRGSEMLVNLPIICYAVFVLFAPYLSPFALIAMFLFGCRIRRDKRTGTIRQEDVTEFVGKASRNIRTTFDSVSQTIRNEPQSAQQETDEGGEYTVE